VAGRPPKQSIDYSGWAVDIFDSDPKIDKLMDAQGCVGFVIYFYLCQRAYGSNGYFYPWCYDDCATTARKVGGGAGAKSVEETVRYCLQIGLFEKRLFDGWNILTSRGIQKRFMQVALTRTNKSVISEYWLLKKEESAGLNFCALNSNLSAGNTDYDPPKSNYQPPKESKVKDSIGKESNKETLSSDLADGETDGEKPRKKKKKDPFPHDHVAYQAAEYMAKRIKKHTPNHPQIRDDVREKTIQRWAQDIEKLLRIDNVDFEEFKRVLAFSQVDPFWQKNILSGEKLRARYGDLLVRMNGGDGDR